MKQVNPDSKSRKYQITINNPLGKEGTEGESPPGQVIYDHDEIKRRLAKMKGIIYYCMGDEKGSTYHTHVFFYSPNAIRFSTVKKLFPTAHIEPAYGSCQKNRDYLNKGGKWEGTEKNETKIEGTFEEWGTMPAHELMGNSAGVQYIYELIENGVSDANILRMYPEAMLHLDKIQRARATLLEDEVKNDWRDLTVTYIFGDTNTGKTRSVMDTFGYENVYRITDYYHPWDSYRMQDVVLFEEFRSSLRIEDMLTYLDGYPCTLPARYANKQAGFTKIFITTNIPLEDQYKEAQENAPETWQAFLRRIHSVQQFCSDRSVITYDTVNDYLHHHNRHRQKSLPRITFPKPDENISDDAFAALMPTDEKE